MQESRMKKQNFKEILKDLDFLNGEVKHFKILRLFPQEVELFIK